MATTPLPASTPVENTATGRVLLLGLPVPNWPEEPLPQAATLPSELKARLCWLPAATATMVFPERTPEVNTATGTFCEKVLLPLPNWPDELEPHAAKVLSEQRARL